MAKEREVLDKALTKPNDKDFINRMVMDQDDEDFPTASDKSKQIWLRE